MGLRMQKKDLLQRDEYIGLLESIVEGKIKQHEGFSLAIDGKWGCGKSFILEKLEKKLRNHNYLVLHYNCWENDFYEEPLVAIVHSMIDAINSKPLESFPEPKRNDWKKTGKVAAKFLGKIGAMILKNKLGVDIQGLKFDVDLEKIATASTEALSVDREEMLNANFDSLQPLKRTILQIRKVLLLMKLEFGGVIFVVDELDRCLPEYAIKVLERLHHICYNAETDRNVFVQVVALNKDEMLGSIASTFGRSFDYRMKIDYSIQSNFPSSATIKPENFHEKQRKFADYYFQKFFQMVIPVPFGKMSERNLAILNGFEENFSDGIVTKDYIAKFLSNVLDKIPMRIKQEYLDFVKTIHQITAFDTSLSKDISLGVLGVELIDSLFRVVFKINCPTLCIHKKENNLFSFRFGKNVELEYVDNVHEIMQAFIEWGKSCYRVLPAVMAADRKERYVNDAKDSASYIKAFYNSGDLRGNFITDSSSSVTQTDKAFVEAFRKVLDIVVPLT